MEVLSKRLFKWLIRTKKAVFHLASKEVMSHASLTYPDNIRIYHFDLEMSAIL